MALRKPKKPKLPKAPKANASAATHEKYAETCKAKRVQYEKDLAAYYKAIKDRTTAQTRARKEREALAGLK